ncbi:MAG: hypothetical protein ACYC9Z_10085 [Casimicrobiaceae bacterium]
MKKTIIVTCVVLAGCATASGVVPMGQHSFMISRQAATGFSGLGNMKPEILEEANQYCVNHKKALQVVRTNESAPPYILGNFPKVEVQFRCE